MSAGRAGSRSAGRLGLTLLFATIAAVAHAQTPERLQDGVALTPGDRRPEVRVCRDDVVRVVDAAPGPFFARQSLVTVVGACQATAFEVKTGPGGFDVTTRRITAAPAPAGTTSGRVCTTRAAVASTLPPRTSRCRST